jgi:hypothetical protein
VGKLRITNKNLNIDYNNKCFIMLQFAKGSFMSTPQTLKEIDEADIDTEFTLDINPENATKLVSINLH